MHGGMLLFVDINPTSRPQWMGLRQVHGVKTYSRDTPHQNSLDCLVKSFVSLRLNLLLSHFRPEC